MFIIGSCVHIRLFDNPGGIRYTLAMVNSNQTDIGVRPGESSPLQRRPVRHRLNLNATVHADTLERLDSLAEKFASSRGSILDKVVLVLYESYKQGKVYCIHGGTCIANRTDLPKIL